MSGGLKQEIIDVGGLPDSPRSSPPNLIQPREPCGTRVIFVWWVTVRPLHFLFFE